MGQPGSSATTVRIDDPGHLNGFATDVTLVSQDAVKDEKGLWSHQDAEFVTVGFGSCVDLTVTDLDLTLKTDGFPRD